MIELFPEYEAYVEFYLSAVAKIKGEKTKESIRKFIKKGNVFANLSEQVLEEICRYVEQKYDVSQSKGFSVIHDHIPWLTKKKQDQDIEFHYWGRFYKYLLKDEKLPENVINTLDNATDDILDYCGNPWDESLKRKGLVIGNVQSGKTTNYSGLICKAADAGYKVFILLTGLTNSLRSQTQERLDNYFIGRKIEYGLQFEEIGAAKRTQSPRFAIPATTTLSDFSKSSVTKLAITLDDIKEPIIFITKKNTSTLKSLYAWLMAGVSSQEKIDYPLMLIDDEADNASINTSKDPERTTKINNGIRELLSLFSKSSYVGYTATPFANIFINSDSDISMENDDLFPSNFIKMLHPPSNYIGPDKIFGEGAEKNISPLRPITDSEDILPLKHKNHAPVHEIPESLMKAVRMFVLCRAIRILQGKGRNHCTMMVNVSRFNSVQEEVRGKIHTYLKILEEAIFVNANRGNAGLKNEHLQSLKKTYTDEYSDFKGNNFNNEWEEIQKYLNEGIASVMVQSVNMSSEKLDYQNNKEDGLHVIGVGGFALSRGLTLEGLCISYVLRNASAYDTLLQMGRWFGYREGYADLCRLFINNSSVDYYEYGTRVLDELRTEIKIMEENERTPLDFALKVRHYPDAINITARNKMRHAQRMTFASDLSLSLVEGYSLFNDEKVNNQNRQTVKKFLASLGSRSSNGNIVRPRFFWEDIEVKKVTRLISDFILPTENGILGLNMAESGLDKRTIAHDYIGERVQELAKWDIALPEVQNSDYKEKELIENEIISCRSRLHGALYPPGEKNYRITKNRKVAEGSGSDAKWGLPINKARGLTNDKEINSMRMKPLLVIQVFKSGLDPENVNFELNSSICVTLSIFFPGTIVPVTEKEYFIGPVTRKLMNDQDEDEEADKMQEKADDFNKE